MNATPMKQSKQPMTSVFLGNLPLKYISKMMQKKRFMTKVAAEVQALPLFAKLRIM
jgi:hypothetical protein